jgi:hypothetical protein
MIDIKHLGTKLDKQDKRMLARRGKRLPMAEKVNRIRYYREAGK